MPTHKLPTGNSTWPVVLSRTASWECNLAWVKLHQASQLPHKGRYPDTLSLTSRTGIGVGGVCAWEHNYQLQAVDFLLYFKACKTDRYTLLTNTNFTTSLKIKEISVKASYVKSLEVRIYLKKNCHIRYSRCVNDSNRMFFTCHVVWGDVHYCIMTMFFILYSAETNAIPIPNISLMLRF